MYENIFRVVTASVSSLWALPCILLMVIFGKWFVTRLILKQAKPGEHVRIKSLIFSIETGPPASPPAPEDADGKNPEQRPPAVEPPKLADPDPPS
ncbi:hypothetical protein NQK81_22195 [Amycolatopsis roodepoortensis]|uniref:hypothetical protein n=1 Tax=Amycolatopsis roodepoortensis TaxID=700274 RepID=UPI00214BC2C6|nr:hypothetical protein [Amycolatopsis roodepoortensis]UUV36033.1 hypothetical protein NQK81_22195 [Amycolatopsis roodepoortensis]